MAYVNKQNLSDFWTNAKRYIAARDADQCDWTSIPVNAPVYRFEAEPRTPVNPVVEFGFTETPPAEGEKGPDNPSTITGVDSVTVTRMGKNLLLRTNTGYSGYAITRNADGSLTVSGSGAAMFSVTDGGPGASGTKSSIILDTSKYYTLSVELVSGTVSGVPCVSLVAPSEQDVLLTIPSTGKASKTFIHRTSSRFVCRILVSADESLTNAVLRIQLEEGATATAFEAPMLPTEVSATVSLGETRYGGTLDVATGKMTVTWGSLNFTSVDNFQGNNGTCVKFAHISTTQKDTHYSGSYPDFFACSMFPVLSSSPQDVEFCRAIGPGDGGSQSAVFSILKSRLDVSGAADPSNPTNAEWLVAINAWLAEHPVTYYFKCYVPVTIDLDPQQLFSALSNSKVNTVFTDTGTISQLTYAKPAPSQEDVFRYANWHRTETARTVVCCPVPESELHPVVNFSFTETPPAEGEKGPENPSTIAGVSSVNVLRWGKNINNDAAAAFSRYATRDSNGWITGIVPAESTSTPAWQCRFGWQLPTDIDYCAVVEIAELVNSGGLILSTNPADNISQLGNNNTVLATTGVHVVPLYYYKTRVNGAINLIRPIFYSKITANQESKIKYRISILPMSANEIDPSTWNYEACNEHRATLNLGSTYYGGSIDLSTGLMTVTQQGFIFDGSENWTSSSSGRFEFSLSSANNAIWNAYSSQKCTHYQLDSSGVADNRFWLSTYYIYIRTSGTLESFKSFLAAQYAGGTPLVVTYALLTPYTIQLTPQQLKALPALDRHSPRINTLYTDADSIQVSYQKSPIQTEREITDAILALGSGLGI